MSATEDEQEQKRLDPSAVAALYVEHGEQLRRFLVGVLRDPQLAADAMQAAFAKMVERGHETQPESRKAWLFRVAYHEAMALRRRETTTQRVVQQFAWQKLSASGSQHHSADEPLLRGEAVEAVRQALAQLSDQQRQIVQMRIYEDKTFAQIAQELDIPLGTALSRMRAALAHLQNKLKK